MTFRSFGLVAFCALAVACSSKDERAPAINPHGDSGFADRTVPETPEELDAGSEDASDEGGDADGDTLADTTPADAELDGDAVADVEVDTILPDSAPADVELDGDAVADVEVDTILPDTEVALDGDLVDAPPDVPLE
jgi:hypothetical protein